MGLEQSKPIQRSKSFSRAMSSLSEQNLESQMVTFSSELASLVCLQTNTSAFDYQIFQRLPFKEHYSPLPVCSNISTNGSSIFICYDCSINEEAYLCENCFEKGEHDSHRFSVYTDNANYSLTFCRCGDSDFMKKGKICKDHKEAPKISLIPTEKKEAAKFNAYFTELFTTLHILQNRRDYLITAMLNYLQKLTENNLYYSKMFLEFLFLKSAVEKDTSNLVVLLKMINFQSFAKVFRNLNFVDEYKKKFLIEAITAIKGGNSFGRYFQEFIIHFAGTINLFIELAKEDELIIETSSFFEILLKLKVDTTQLWRCAVKKNMVQVLLHNNQVMKTLINKLCKEEKFILLILEQLLEQPVARSNQYVLACLMILTPELFIRKSQSLNLSNKVEDLLCNYYKQILMNMSLHQNGNKIYSELILLLPFFSFGEKLKTKFWDEFKRRVLILQGYKDKKQIKSGSWNCIDILNNLVKSFVSWEHAVIKRSNQFSLTFFLKEKDLIKRLLIQVFDKRRKIMRSQLLNVVDEYTQKQRELVKDLIAKELRYHPVKEKYYYVGKILPNNLYNYQKLRVDADLPLSDWQNFVARQFFTDSIYGVVSKLITTAQRALNNDLEMVKTISNLTIFLSLINKKQRSNLKQTTRNFIKEIPDVQESTYYLLADIRDRFELDVDEMEEEGMKGRKKRKLNVIAEIRDKKIQDMRSKLQKKRQKWLKDAEKGFKLSSDEEMQAEICSICKENQGKNDRFVIPCYFTRNSVVSTLLHSDVTDLDMNVCLHQMHEECFTKLKKRNECSVCKFQANCFIPLKPLPDESYTKNWLKTFESITTNINLESGKNFSSDWATIFLTYMVYTRSFKILLKSSEFQQRKIKKIDELIMMHIKSQLQKWPELTKQALDKAEKTVKGQIRRQSNQKKCVKSLILDLVMQEITNVPFKNDKRIYKKIRQLINTIGKENSQKIMDYFPWAVGNEGVEKTFQEGIDVDEDFSLFKISELPSNASDFLKETSIKCPMCDKYQPQAWKCLFCEKMSCQNCMRVRNHCQYDHRGNAMIIYLNDALYELWADNKCVKQSSLYQNQYLEGWKRNMKPDGWKANFQEIYQFFDKILHSEKVEKNEANNGDSESGDENENLFRNQFGNNDPDEDQEQEEENESD